MIYISIYKNPDTWETFVISKEDFELVEDELSKHERTKWYVKVDTDDRGLIQGPKHKRLTENPKELYRCIRPGSKK